MFIEVTIDSGNRYLINLSKVTRISCTTTLTIWSGKDHKVIIDPKHYEEIKSKIIQLNIDIL